MQKTARPRTVPIFSSQAFLLLVIFISFCFTSPRSTLAIFPWVAVTALLRFVRQASWSRSILWSWLITFPAAVIASWVVVPLPVPVMLVFTLVASLVGLVPYLIDKWLHQKFSSWFSTLIFPAAMVSLDYLAAQGGQGTWGNYAYQQYSLSWLMQLASVTGIWGIGFMVYWFAAVFNWFIEKREQKQSGFRILFTYGLVLGIVLAFGFIRLKTSRINGAPIVKVAAITIENLPILEEIHYQETGENIKISPKSSQADPQLNKVSKSMIAFIENSDDPKFSPVFKKVDQLVAALFLQSEQAVASGARLISWSEGVFSIPKYAEQAYIDRGRAFAKKHQVWFYMPFVAFIPGKIEPGDKFLENKTLVINPAGEVVNTYFKNIPVSGVEPSVPGDGVVPVIGADFGKLSSVICYDADFPKLIRQTSEKDTELLIVPSGDWAAISPVHSHMAVVRSIENGVALLRPVSKGLSIATDAYGRVIAKDDYFEDDDHILLAEIPLKQVRTVYGEIGDSFVYMCMGILGLMFLLSFIGSRPLSTIFGTNK